MPPPPRQPARDPGSGNREPDQTLSPQQQVLLAHLDDADALLDAIATSVVKVKAWNGVLRANTRAATPNMGHVASSAEMLRAMRGAFNALFVESLKTIRASTPSSWRNVAESIGVSYDPQNPEAMRRALHSSQENLRQQANLPTHRPSPRSNERNEVTRLDHVSEPPAEPVDSQSVLQEWRTYLLSLSAEPLYGPTRDAAASGDSWGL